MIVGMKKITLVLLAKEAHSALGKLRRLGVLHVEHIQPPKGKNLNTISDDILLVNQAIASLLATSIEAKKILYQMNHLIGEKPPPIL